MQVTFRQGIVRYPTSGSNQAFLVPTGNYMTLSTTLGTVDISFAQRSNDYLLTETATVNNAWGPLVIGPSQWLYWDIDTRTAIRTFGITLVQPTYGVESARPVSAVEDTHYFDTTNKIMYVYKSGGWRNVIRVFAAKVTAPFTQTNIIPLGSGFGSLPFAGSQVGITNTVSFPGRIIYQDSSSFNLLPIRRSDSTFLTTENQFFTIGSPINVIKLEANVVLATASTNIGAYAVVAYDSFGVIRPAVYADAQSTTIGIMPQALLIGQSGNVVIQGKVDNPLWNWTTAGVGAALWISDTSPGDLVSIDPFISNPIANPVPKPPVARTISQTEVIFDQGLGGLIQSIISSSAVTDGQNLDLSGASVFAQKNGSILQFRTLKSSTLAITQNANNITLETSAENNTGANLGTGAAVFAGKTGTILNFKTLKSLSSNLTITSTSEEVQFNINLGGGGGGSGITLCELDDFDIACSDSGTLEDGSILVFNSGTQKWETQAGLPYDIHMSIIGPAGVQLGQIVAGTILSRPVVIPPGAGWCDGLGTNATSGYQRALFTLSFFNNDSTGLNNDGTVYDATIRLNGTDYPVSIIGSDAQTVADLVVLLGAISNQISVSHVNGTNYIAVSSLTVGPTSEVAMFDGTGPDPLFSSLSIGVIPFSTFTNFDPATSGTQTVDVGGTRLGTSPTGLANDATVYSATVAVDGGVPQPISFAGSAAQTYTTLLAELNADTTGAVWSLVAGNIVCTSAITGLLSTIVIADSNLFSSLTTFVSVLAPVDGTAGVPGTSGNAGRYPAQAYAHTPADGPANVDYTVLINDVPFGLLQFIPGDSVGAFEFTEPFNHPLEAGLGLQPGTRITLILNNAVADTGIRDVTISFSGITMPRLPTEGCILI